MTPDLARQILSLNLPPAVHARFGVLSRKAQQGALSPQEAEELDSYLHWDNVLAVLRVKADRSLQAEAERLAAGSQPNPNQATLDLLAQWEREEQTSDPAEIARREREVTEFIEGINRTRTECEGPGARKIFP